MSLRAILKDVRYRFDYGLSTQLSGRLSLLVPPAERMRLSGRLVVERGVLNRDVNLDREVLDLFLRPAKAPGTEETALDTLDLSSALSLGLRARTPVGLLRLDVGFPLDRKVQSRSYKLYVGFGNSF